MGNSSLTPVPEENPTPWNRIKQDEGVKLLQVNQTFDKKCAVFFRLYRILLNTWPDGAETSTKDTAGLLACRYLSPFASMPRILSSSLPLSLPARPSLENPSTDLRGVPFTYWARQPTLHSMYILTQSNCINDIFREAIMALR